MATARPLLSTQFPRKAINETIPVVFAADDVPVAFPAIVVPPGCSVTLRGVTSTGANLGVVRVATYREGLQSGDGTPITPDTEIAFSVDHLGQIWAVGKKDDGLVARISGVPIG